MAARQRLFGLTAAVLGTATVFTLILLMNAAAKRRDAEVETGTAIAFERREAPKQQAVERKPPPRRRQQAPRPNVDLSSMLPGLSFGLPGFDEGDLGDLTGGLLGDDRDLVMSDETVDQPPRPVAQSPIPYPARAKAQGVTGYVMLSVLIGPTGAVEKVRVLESQPSGVFDDAAVAGVQRWRFEPASYRGENVRVWARQRVRFDLG
jgi:protein TonB